MLSLTSLSAPVTPKGQGCAGGSGRSPEHGGRLPEAAKCAFAKVT